MRILTLSLLPFFLLGCMSGQKKKVQSTTAHEPAGTVITELNLLAMPVVVNFDGVPGPDGFVVKIYAGNRKHPKPIPIVTGTLDFLMYDGLLPRSDEASAKPRHTWSLKAEDLKRYEMTTSIGTGYQIDLRWGEGNPTGDKITAVARYTSVGGVMVYSAPSVIAVMMK